MLSCMFLEALEYSRSFTVVNVFFQFEIYLFFSLLMFVLFRFSHIFGNNWGHTSDMVWEFVTPPHPHPSPNQNRKKLAKPSVVLQSTDWQWYRHRHHNMQGFKCCFSRGKNASDNCGRTGEDTSMSRPTCTCSKARLLIWHTGHSPSRQSSGANDFVLFFPTLTGQPTIEIGWPIHAFSICRQWTIMFLCSSGG